MLCSNCGVGGRASLATARMLDVSSAASNNALACHELEAKTRTRGQGQTMRVRDLSPNLGVVQYRGEGGLVVIVVAVVVALAVGAVVQF